MNFSLIVLDSLNSSEGTLTHWVFVCSLSVDRSTSDQGPSGESEASIEKSLVDLYDWMGAVNMDFDF